MSAIAHPINPGSAVFAADRHTHYEWLREQAPVYKGKISLLNFYFVSRYEDCQKLTRDPRFLRNRATVTGGSRMPFPVPASVSLLAQSMIVEDDPEHRRLRTLVQKAFTLSAIRKLEARIDELTKQRLDELKSNASIDLTNDYALPLPVTVIQELMGVDAQDMQELRDALGVLTKGLSGFRILRTLAYDMPRAVRFVRACVDKKRKQPGDDILTGLIAAEEAGDRLSDDELVSMVFLLIIAGFETTVHLITNSVITLLEQPAALDRLRSNPELMESAIEEILRFRSPIQGAKPAYAAEDVEWHGTVVPKGAAIMPMFGAANRDHRAFENPDTFDIARSPNRHLGFGYGNHFCLGAHLARLETKVALRNLLQAGPDLRLVSEPTAVRLPMWERYDNVNVALT